MPGASKPGSVYRTTAWKTTLRKAVYERDGFRCQKCGRLGRQMGGPVTLSMQHLIPERVRLALGRPLLAQDLVTLCLQCHGRADGGRRYSGNH